MLSDLVIPSLVNSICGLASGYNSAIVSGLKVQLIKYTYFDNLEDEDLLSGLYTTSLLFGMVAGSTLGVWIADRIGRRWSLVLSGVILTIIPIILAIIENYWAVFVMKIILGFAVGIGSCVGPMYVTETVEPKYRGRVGSLYQLIITASMAFGYFMNLAFGKDDYDEYKKFEKWQWSIQYAIGALAGVFMLICCIFMKESEVWLNLQKEKKNGKKQQQENETNVIVKKEDEKVTMADKIKWYLFAIIFGAVAQLCGINAIMYYSNTILDKAGISDPYIATACVVGLWNFISTAIAMPFLDRFKRRTLIICTYGGLAVGNLIMAISYVADVTALSIIGIIIFLFMFEWGPGPLFWVVASEAFPNSIRSSGLSVSLTANNLANIVISFCFPILEKAVGAKVVFFIFMAICIFATIYCFFFLPESSNKSVKEGEVTTSGNAVPVTITEPVKKEKEAVAALTTVELPTVRATSPNGQSYTQSKLPTVA